GRGHQWCPVQLRRQRNGDGQGHRIVFAVRTPPAAVHWQGACRLYPQRQGAGSIQSRTHRRHVCPPPANPGKPQPPDRRSDHASDRRSGRCR
nr:hypothetical protein [Tanacetum cinerariifolium]